MPAHPVAGLWGKLPSRGDFVRLGVPRNFTDAWDLWMSAMLVASQQSLGQKWRDLWMVAPAWRFSLGPGICGDTAMRGVWMPSVDSAGRAYPLTLATTAGPGLDGDAWLDAAEDAGLAALALRLEPAEVAARLPAPLLEERPETLGSAWWKAGSADRPYRVHAMPDAALFRQMLS